MTQLTIFTPTYNRAYTLPKLYGSLCRQSNKDFKWLIVDDGSTDNTEIIVSAWQSDNKVDITYVKQPNGGKMCAHNHGVELCDTEFFFCVDSDDFITDNAVEIIYKNLHKCKGDAIGGLVAYRFIGHEAAYRVLTHFPIQGYSTLTDLYNNGFKGDTSLVFKTEVLRRYPFPIIKGEKFITEAYVYSQIDKNYKLYLVDEGLTYCEYMPDGYTSNDLMLRLKYPMGWCLFYLQKLEDEKNASKRREIEAQAFSYYLMYKDKKYADKSTTLEFGTVRTKIHGYLLYLRRIIKYRKELLSIR